MMLSLVLSDEMSKNSICYSAPSDTDESKESSTDSLLVTRPFQVGPGHLATLTDDQWQILLKFWKLIMLTLSHDRSEFDTPHKLRKLAENLCSQSVDVTPSEDAVLANELVADIFRQSVFDDVDTLALRFLRARKWILEDALCMLIECASWRRAFQVERLVLKGEHGVRQDTLQGGKGFIWKEDRKGRLCVWVRARLHDRNAQSLQESIDYSVYWMELGRRLRCCDEQLVTMVFDLAGMPLAALDLPLAQFLVRCLQNYYPEILGMALIVDAPWFFQGFWKMVRPLLDPVVASKIVFVKRSELNRYIHPLAIPSDFGGEDEFSYFYVPSEPKTGNYPVSIPDHVTQKERAFIRRTFSKEFDKEKRDLAKKELEETYRDLYKDYLPENMYNRLHVLSNGAVDWDQYSKHQLCSKLVPTEGRSSAPI